MLDGLDQLDACEFMINRKAIALHISLTEILERRIVAVLCETVMTT